MSRSAVSRHLRVLREAGLLAWRGDAQRRLYRLDADSLAEASAWIERTRANPGGTARRVRTTPGPALEGRTMTDAAPPADDRFGTLGVAAGGRWEIRFERGVRHAPSESGRASSTSSSRPDGSPGYESRARVGGPVVFDFGDEGRAEGEVLVVDPQRVLEHTWSWPGEPDSNCPQTAQARRSSGCTGRFAPSRLSATARAGT